MPCSVVLGSQWGDEGKGKIVDMYSSQADIVMRYQGGHNAGHTVFADGVSYVFHLIPSGIIHKNVINLIGNGMVVDPKALLKEMSELGSKGISFKDRFAISDRAHLILPYHTAADKMSEAKAGSAKLGTTGLGIGPAYTDKANRTGLRVADLLDCEQLKNAITSNVAQYNILARHLYNAPVIDAEPIIDEYAGYGAKLAPYITDTIFFVNKALGDEKKVLLEGAQGAMLDIDFGTYPFVTSSNGSSGGAVSGSGISPRKLSNIVGVTKAYCTRVGSGPFPTELGNAAGEYLRTVGKEYGATTGRPRRCGFIDLVALRYAVMINGMTHIALTKLDVLSGLDEVKACVSYRIDGKKVMDFPASAHLLAKAEPVYKTFKGWKLPLSDIKSVEALPKEARVYLDFIEEFLGTPFGVISVGYDRNASIAPMGIFP
jgi:adenylosuccinate synthase